MYNFVDIKSIAKQKVVKTLRNLDNRAAIICMQQNSVIIITETALERFYSLPVRSLISLDSIITEIIEESIIKQTA